MAEIRWIDRDANGKLCGHYARQQRPGQECLPEGHAELVAFDAEMKAQMEAAQKAAVDKDAQIATLAASVKALTDKVTALEAKVK